MQNESDKFLQWSPPQRQRFALDGGTGKKKSAIVIIGFGIRSNLCARKEQITKNLEQINEHHQKRLFLMSYATTDVAIEFYAKNYLYRLISKSEQLNIAENELISMLIG